MRNKRLIILFSVLLSITLLVVFNSVLFSVQHVYASCLNVEGEDAKYYEKIVLENHKIKRGASIFFLDKAEVTENVEKATGYRVKVLNVEKSFPNRIYINYVEVKAYARVAIGKDTYYIRNDMVVMDSVEGESTVELVFGTDDVKFTKGEAFAYTTPSGINAPEALTQIINGYESCGKEYTHNQFTADFKRIDLSGKNIKIVTAYGVTEGGTAADGLVIEIINTQSLAQKIRFAISVYPKLTSEQKSGGTLIITGEKKASYRGKNGTVTDV